MLETTAETAQVDYLWHIQYMQECQIGDNLHILCLRPVCPKEVPLALSNVDFDYCVSRAPGA